MKKWIALTMLSAGLVGCGDVGENQSEVDHEMGELDPVQRPEESIVVPPPSMQPEVTMPNEGTLEEQPSDVPPRNTFDQE